MAEINVNLKGKSDNSYKIFIQKRTEIKLPGFLKKNKYGNKYAIICDSKTKRLFGNALFRHLRKNKIECDIFDFPHGEKSKTLSTIEALSEKMIEKKYDRKDAVIALGGGVVGDVAGFLASVFMRGIPYIQIPTTLLAMVDSSIGGKTGVDLQSGKNLVGSFYQPKAVFIDLKYLKTLPDKQIRNGLAEIIKYGVIKEVKLFKFIEQNTEEIFNRNEKILTYLIAKSVEIKQKVVEEDEKESGKRMILNYGHTYGHALEKKSDFKLLHGHAISIGMVLANKMAVEKELLNKKDAERIRNLFIKAGLPITVLNKPTMKDLLSDKKRIGDYINFILPTKIGEVKIIKIKCK